MKISLDTDTKRIICRALEERHAKVRFTFEYCTEMIRAVEGHKEITRDEVMNIIWALTGKIKGLTNELNMIQATGMIEAKED